MATDEKRMISIPYSNTFYCDFKFDLSLPDASPGPKYLYYPFNHDTHTEYSRFRKPRLTNLNYTEKPQIYTCLDLSIPIDDLNVKPELFSHDPTRDNVLTEEDEVFLGLKKLAQLAPQPTATDKEAEALAIALRRRQGIARPLPLKKGLSHQHKEGFDLADDLITPDSIYAQLKSIVDKSFDRVAEKKIVNHPSKQGVTAVETFMLLPNFNDIDKKYQTVANNVIPPNFDLRSGFLFQEDQGTRMIEEMCEDPSAMKEEGKIRLKHNQDYHYYMHDGTTKDSEVIKRQKYILMYNNKDKQARYSKVANELLLWKVKDVPQRTKGTQNELVVAARKAFESEANTKASQLSRMGPAVLDKYKITETQPDPPKPERPVLPPTAMVRGNMGMIGSIPSRIRPGAFGAPRRRPRGGYDDDEEDELANADSIGSEDSEDEDVVERRREMEQITKNLSRQNRPKIRPRAPSEDEDDGSFDYERAERRRKLKKKNKPAKRKDKPAAARDFLDEEASESDDGDEEDEEDLGSEEASEGEYDDGDDDEDEGSFQEESEEKPAPKKVQKAEPAARPKRSEPAKPAAGGQKTKAKPIPDRREGVKLKGEGDVELQLDNEDENEDFVPKMRKKVQIASDEEDQDRAPPRSQPTHSQDPRTKKPSSDDDDEFLQSDDDK